MYLTAYDDQFLLAALVIISMALIFYSVGVWSERIQGRLKGWHVVAFGLGVTCNFVGTAFMAESERLTGHDNHLRAVIGSIAIFVMAAHAVWAFRVFRKGTTQAKHRFSRLGVVVWCIWLILYFVGMYLGMSASF
ncbi:HsmA family protein [Odoribacter sp. Z80]|uniref:HsmA family protein n=1 Tax=Odoribacter sp. Z80 TaxID=2304575 RepID=UPI001379B15B|nr:HsmA family protein [Odoribacter sp. Z80]NCE73041.1 TIGR03987 family protein [Odoribacter sp. Z80]